MASVFDSISLFDSELEEQPARKIVKRARAKNFLSVNIAKTIMIKSPG